MTKTGSPQYFRDQWSFANTKLEDFFESLIPSKTFRIGAIFSLIAVQYYLSFVTVSAVPNLNFVNLSTFRTFFLSLVVWGLGGFVLQSSREWRGSFVTILFFMHILSVVLLFQGNEHWAGAGLQVLIMCLQAILAYILCDLAMKWPAWTSWVTALIIAVLSYALFFVSEPISQIEWISLRANPTRYVMFISFFALQVHFLHVRFKNKGEKFTYVFNPTQNLYPLPLPLEGVQKIASSRTYARALLNIIFATVAMALFIALTWAGFPRSYFAYAFTGYIYQFLYLFYLAAFSVGLLQWCGFDIPNPCNFALLSASPHLRWRRWNRYTYKWLSLSVFFPVLQRTGSRLFALLVSFCLVALLHLNGMFFVPGAKVAGGDLPVYLRNHFLYYLGHGLAIWLGFFVPNSWTDERRRSSWIGVAVTWLLAACIFTLYY